MIYMLVFGTIIVHFPDKIVSCSAINLQIIVKMKHLQIFFVTAISAMIIFTAGCNKDKTKGREFLIHVDSIQVADTIMQGDTLDIAFFGTIGTNGCYSFNRFDVDFTGDSINIGAIGSFSGGDVCPEVLVKLDGAVLQITNLTVGKYYLVIKQPETASLTKEVMVANSPGR